jgi:hypothetical protein
MDTANPATWNHLSHLQIGRYAEYYVKMEAVRLGHDVYSAEVCDKGIDFVLRRGDGSGFLEVQVKAMRWPQTQYVFIAKSILPEPRSTYLLCLVLFEEGKPPDLYAIPSTVWNQPNSVFVSRDYEGWPSKPEWGVQLSAKARNELEQYRFKGDFP